MGWPHLAAMSKGGCSTMNESPFEMAVMTWSGQRAQIVILNGGWHNRHLKQRLKAQLQVVARVYNRPWAVALEEPPCERVAAVF
jgi:hypothetical protein